MDLFTEVFPIARAMLPALAAYEMHMPGADASTRQQAGKMLAFRLRRSFPGIWLWMQDCIITDTPVIQVQMDITVNILREQREALLATIESLTEMEGWHPTAHQKAEWIIRTVLRSVDGELREALNQLGSRLPNAYVMREHHIEPWSAFDIPALSIAVESRLLHDRNLQQVLVAQGESFAADTQVMDRLGGFFEGHVTGIIGKLGTLREELLVQSQNEAMQRYLQKAPDDTFIVEVTGNQGTYPFPASALRVAVRTNIPDDWERFGINPEEALQATRVTPEVRAMFVRTISTILKEKSIIGNAFNSRSEPDLFAVMDFLPSLVYADRRVRPYRMENPSIDFLQSGLHTRHARFVDAPIRAAFINTLDTIASDFMEALRRQIERDFAFTIDLVRERNMRVVNENTIASAVRAVQKEAPQIVLAFFPDPTGDGDAHADYLKSLTLGKGIASHVVNESTIHDPNAMATVIMALLAKTGNTPFALAEPIEYADYIVGLDLVREQLSRGDRVVAMTRIYRNDGVFVRYLMDHVELETDEPIPFVVLQRIFPEDLFTNQRIIIHHEGMLHKSILQLLARWGQVLHSDVYPVEILRDHVPHIYALEGGISQAKWGTIFRMNERASFAITGITRPDQATQPLHIQVPMGELPIEQAVYSVLAWTLLQYSGTEATQLPVTIQYARDMAQWMARGMLPEATQGDVPFWL